LARVTSEQQVKPDIAPHNDPKQLLTSIFCSSALGFAILDDQLRFQAINKALAEMNGIPTEVYLGRTLRDLLGPLAAAQLEPKLARTFATGENICFRLVTALPSRTDIGYWTVSCFPMERLNGCVTRICAILTELTIRKQLELYLYGFSRKLLSLRASLNSRTHRLGDHSQGKLLDSCISELVAISRLPGSPLDEITPEVLGQYEQLSFVGQLPIKRESSASSLPRRARQVVQHLARGECNKEIGLALGISVRTVEKYRAEIKVRLGIRSSAELVVYAVRNNII